MTHVHLNNHKYGLHNDTCLFQSRDNQPIHSGRHAGDLRPAKRYYLSSARKMFRRRLENLQLIMPLFPFLSLPLRTARVAYVRLATVLLFIKPQSIDT